jgi:hypothetical protein
MKLLKYFLLVIVSVLLFLMALTNVSTALDPEDVIASKIILQTEIKPIIYNYDDEIRIIRWAQSRVFDVAPGMEPIPNYMDREPMDLLKSRSGLCYDRSRTLDKLLKWLGFETRHVYILFAKKGDETNFINFLQYAFTHSQSHAVTEVKTSRGWLLVDSNKLWISIDRNGLPVSAGLLHVKKSEFINSPDYTETPYWAIRGMYSRKGRFYRPFIYFPEFNWPDFLLWMLETN